MYGLCELPPHLHPQTHGVQHNEQEHEVLKVAGSDDVPDLVLVRVLGNITPQRSCFESVLHTLTLRGMKSRE